MGAGRTALNTCIIITLIITWIACIVGFAGPLHRARIGSRPEANFYWDKLQSDDQAAQDFGEIKKSDRPQIPANAAGQCDSGGAAFLSMLVFAFICINLLFLFLLLRAFGKPVSTYAWPELALMAAASLFMALACISWGATCWSSIRNTRNTTTKMTGFGFVIAATSLICLALPFMIWLARKYAKGAGATSMFSVGAPGGPSESLSSSMWNRIASWTGGTQGGGLLGTGGPPPLPREQPQPHPSERTGWMPSFHMPGWESEAAKEERRARDQRERWMQQQWQQQQHAALQFPQFPGQGTRFEERPSQPPSYYRPPIYQQQLPLQQAISHATQQELQSQRERMHAGGRQIPIQEALAQHPRPQQQSQFGS